MEDVDLCHRLLELRPGTFRVLPERRWCTTSPGPPGRYARYLVNRELYLERWAGRCEPRDDGRQVGDPWLPGRRPRDHRARTAQRRGSASRSRCWSGRPGCRSGRRRCGCAGRSRTRHRPAPRARRWGDTHFAGATADALRAVGQEVVIDHRPEFDRPTSRHDDVVLVLRGVAPFQPSPEQVSIGWVISHPEMLSWQEAAAYDRLVAASVTWAADDVPAMGDPVDPLLQATDPDRFHPDRAVPDTGHPVLFVGNSRHSSGRSCGTRSRPACRSPCTATRGGSSSPRGTSRRRTSPTTTSARPTAAAGVVLNDHWDDMRATGSCPTGSSTPWRAAPGSSPTTSRACGEVFGESVQVYRTPDDLTRLSSLPDPSTVFGDDDSIRAEAARIAREHSFRARAEQLVVIALEERRRRGFDG